MIRFEYRWYIKHNKRCKSIDNKSNFNKEWTTNVASACIKLKVSKYESNISQFQSWIETTQNTDYRIKNITTSL